jgi:hypothetical protein
MLSQQVKMDKIQYSRLDSHILNKLEHEEKYKTVMNELTLTQDSAKLKEYLLTFVEHPTETTKILKTAKSLVSDFDEKNEVFEHSKKVYDLMGLDSALVLKTSDCIDSSNSLNTIIDNSIVNFKNKVCISEILHFNDFVEVTAQSFFPVSENISFLLNFFLNKNLMNNEIMGLTLHPILFKVLTPMLFFSFALPLLTSANFTCFFSRIIKQIECIGIPRVSLVKSLAALDSISISPEPEVTTTAITAGVTPGLENIGGGSSDSPVLDDPGIPARVSKILNDGLESSRQYGFGISFQNRPFLYGVTLIVGSVFLNSQVNCREMVMSAFNNAQNALIASTVQNLRAVIPTPQEFGQTAGVAVRVALRGFISGIFSTDVRKPPIL